MNIENAKKLSEQLKRLPDEKFEMDTWITHSTCGTVACIAGWCSLLNGGPQNYGEGVKYFAEKFLGLDYETSDRLFRGFWSSKHIDSISRVESIAELDRMIAEATQSPGA